MTKQKRPRAASAVQPSPAARPAREARGRVVRSGAPVLLLIALAVLAYANALGNGFVLDDIPIIVENPLVRSPANIGAIFETNYWNRGGAGFVGDATLYRPLTVFSYAVDYALWGPSPTAFHAVNVVLHAAVTVMVFLVAASALGAPVAAFAAAAIFAVHPVHVEAVTSIVGRAEVLATLFLLAAFWTLRRRRAFVVEGTSRASLPRTLGPAAGGAGLYLLGLFSKESAVTLPALLALDDWLRRDELPRDPRSRITILAMRYGALVVALGIYLALRQQAVSGGAQIWPGFLGVSAGDRILTASRVILEYIVLFVFPRTLLADYWKTEVPVATSIAEPIVLLSLATWVGIAVVLYRCRRNAPLVLSIAWFFVTIALVSNIFFPIGVAMAERLLYLPSVGLCLTAGLGYALLEANARARPVVRGALALVLVALTTRTVVRNRDWRDNLTLAEATLAVSPSSPLMNDIAAEALVKRGEGARAIELLREAVRQAPDMPLIRTHLGAAYQSQGLIDQAIAEYREAIRRNPTDAGAHNNLGVALLDKGRAAEAIAALEAAIRIDPAYADPHMNLGVVHLERGRLNEAAEAFAAAAQADPMSAEARNALGVVYARMGQVQRAAEQYRAALRLKPDHAGARENLARLGGARPSEGTPRR